MPKKSALTARALLLGSLGSILISASSVYVALRLGALPWTILFASILSFIIIRQKGRGSMAEVNITHTAMTAGSMTAGAAAFILPALWRINPSANLPFGSALASLCAGSLCALVFMRMLRPLFIEQSGFPYAIGQAASQSLAAAEAGGVKAAYLFAASGLAALYALLRDQWNLLPQSTKALGKQGQLGSISLSPMAAAMGYVLGPAYALPWAASALLAILVLTPLSVRAGLFATLEEAGAFRASMGIGMMIGAGAGSLAKPLIAQRKAFKVFFASKPSWTKNKKNIAKGLIIAALLICLLKFGADLSWPAAALFLPILFIVCALAALLVGQAGINPLEVLGVLALLALGLFFKLPTLSALLAAAAATTACGLAGDMMNDFKVGSILKTNPSQMLASEAVGALVGAAASIAALFAIRASFGSFGSAFLPAPQSAGVAAIISGAVIQNAFALGIGCGLAICLLPVAAITIALGFYLGLSISVPIGIGGLIALLSRPNQRANGVLAASGILAGEGFMGAMLALINMALKK